VPSSTTGFAGRLPDLPIDASGHLRVDRDAVPHLRKVFDSALSKLDVQIDLAMTAVRVAPWAGDPVSENAATAFNAHAVDDGDSALNALRAYQQRLKAASDALTQVAEEYRIVESDNTARFGAQGGC
jgi:xanthine dehydrogenase molybdopterin-binding subunit B